jgi:hypothetical protein
MEHRPPAIRGVEARRSVEAPFQVVPVGRHQPGQAGAQVSKRVWHG